MLVRDFLTPPVLPCFLLHGGWGVSTRTKSEGTDDSHNNYEDSFQHVSPAGWLEWLVMLVTWGHEFEPEQWKLYQGKRDFDCVTRNSSLDIRPLSGQVAIPSATLRLLRQGKWGPQESSGVLLFPRLAGQSTVHSLWPSHALCTSSSFLWGRSVSTSFPWLWRALQSSQAEDPYKSQLFSPRLDIHSPLKFQKGTEP